MQIMLKRGNLYIEKEGLLIQQKCCYKEGNCGVWCPHVAIARSSHSDKVKVDICQGGVWKADELIVQDSMQNSGEFGCQ